MFDYKKPNNTNARGWQLASRFRPGTIQKKKSAETGQVCIMVRNVGGIVGEDAGGGRTVTQDDNPGDSRDVRLGITNALREAGYVYATDYVITQVPNIVDISYGRGVGYTFTEHDLGKEIHD